MAVPISISEFLDRNHVRYSLVSHPAAYAAQEEAAAAHVSGHEWAKAVVCIADDRPILAVLVGTRIRESVGVIYLRRCKMRSQPLAPGFCHQVNQLMRLFVCNLQVQYAPRLR